MKIGMKEVLLAFTLSLIMFSSGYLLGQRRTSSLTPFPAGHPRVRMELTEELEEIEERPLTFYSILERESGNPHKKEGKKEVFRKKESKSKEKTRAIVAGSEDRYSIQVSSYKKRVKALSHLNELKRKGYKDLYITAVEIEGKGSWYRLRCGPFDKKDEAQKLAEKMSNESGRKVYVVKLD
jgi:hypothetical protein